MKTPRSLAAPSAPSTGGGPDELGAAGQAPVPPGRSRRGGKRGARRLRRQRRSAGRAGRWGRSPASTIASRRPCSGEAASRRPSRRRRLPPTFLSTPTTRRTRSGSSTGRPGHSSSPSRRGQGAVDARPPAGAAAGGADHAACLRRGLERDRTLVGCSVPDLSGADRHRLTARYVGFTCGDDYWTSIDMASALHPQTILALDYAGAPLPPKYGFPVKLRIPTKLGFKNPKHIMASP